MASYWNWEDPSGAMGKSTLDPTFNDSERQPSWMWMSLTQYLDLCASASLRPLVGVNYNCHKHEEWVPLNESIARAVRQIEFVALQRGFKGAMYYIGNEVTCLER